MDKKKEILNGLSLAHKTSLLSGLDGWHTKAFPEAGVGSVSMADGPNGLRKEITREGEKPGVEDATSFPNSCLMAASFDVDLMKELGKTLAAEAKEKGVNLLLGPGINIKRSPLCGRNFEYFSEDPIVAGELGAALIEGLQEEGVGATVKHFAMNNQEIARLTNNSIADERAKREIYLTGFETVIKKANPWAVMSSYNKVDGVYTSENTWLLKDILRGEWGYKGVVMSDWGAVNNRASALRAGLDLEMPGNNGFHDRLAEEAVKEGSLSESYVDEAVLHILELAEKSGHLKTRGDRQETFDVDYEKQHKLAQRFAAESMVLLKNEENLLPLRENEQSIAVIGEFAEKPRYQGGGSANVHPVKLPSFLEELKTYTKNAEFAAGYRAGAEEAEEEEILRAAALAKGRDAVVVLAGLPNIYEAEGYDRIHMGLPKGQNELIQRVAEVNPNTVVVLFAGGPVEMPWIDKVKAVVMAYLPGQAGSGAICELLFGRLSPSGKLPETFPVKWEDSPCHPYFGQENNIEYRESIFVGYRYFGKKRKVLFPFGHGLSYSSFAYEDLITETKEDGTVNLRMTLQNTGRMAAAEVVQVYVEAPVSGVARPELELKAFRKVYLHPGEKRELEFSLPLRSFAYYNVNIQDWHVLSGTYRILLGASSRDLRLEGEVLQKDSHPGAVLPDLMKEAPEYYDLDRITQVSNHSFSAVLGHPVRPYSNRPLHPSSNLIDISDCFLGKNIGKLIRKIALSGDGSPPQEGHDMRVMFERQVDYLPIRSIVVYTRGGFSYEMLDGMVLFMNKKRIKGLISFLKAWNKAKRKKGSK